MKIIIKKIIKIEREKMETFIDNNAELNLSQYSYLRPSENLLSVYANHSSFFF